VRVLLINFMSVRLAVVLGVLAMATPAHAAPISAHAMVHTCCMEPAMNERIFAEAEALGADFIRVDVEIGGIFKGAPGQPDWSRLDEVMALAKRHHLRVLGLLLATPAYLSSCPERGPQAGLCAPSDTTEFGRLAGAIAEHARGTIGHWEVLNEPDADWAFAGTPEQYAGMLRATHDAIKARVPDARVVLGGLQRPADPAWLDRVLATPGADAIHGFDVASLHLRGPVGPVVNRYRQFRASLGQRGFDGPLWITEFGYPADPAYQDDPAFTGGDAAQAAYLTESLVDLGEAGAEQVFVTLRDEGEGEYASEGLVHIDGGPDAPATRRPAFDAVRRLATRWNEVMGWRREQRRNERVAQRYQALSAAEASQARLAREQLSLARGLVPGALNAYADARGGGRTRKPRGARARQPLLRRLARVRARVAATQTSFFWHGAYARRQSERAHRHAVAAKLLRRRIAGAP
jgi:hypothetical protein